MVADSDTTDNDTANISLEADAPAATLIGIENLNMTVDAGFNRTIDAANISDSTLNIATNVTGGDSATVTNLGAADDNLTIAPQASIANLTVSGAGNNPDTGTFNIAQDLNLTVNDTGADDDLESMVLNADGDATVTAGTNQGNSNTWVADADNSTDLTINSGSNDLTVTAAVQNIFSGLDITANGDGTTTIVAVDDTSVSATAFDASNYTGVDVVELQVDDPAADDFADGVTITNNQVIALNEDVTSFGNLDLANAAQAGTDYSTTIQISNDQTTNAIRVGGAGNSNLFDTVNLQALADVTIAEVVGTTADTTVNVSGSNNLTLTAVTANEVVATGATGNLTVSTNANVDTVTGGEGDDTFTITDDTADFTYDGGSAGTDTLAVAANGADFIAETLTINNVDIIEIDSDDGGAQNFTFTAAQLDGESFTFRANGDNDTLSVDGSNTANVDLGSLVVNGSEITDVYFTPSGVANTITLTNADDTVLTQNGGQADVINGGAGNDLLAGQAGADTLDGGTGDDQFWGGAGEDTLTGGTGDDEFLWQDETNGPDEITDFSQSGTNGNDAMWFDVGTTTVNTVATGSDPFTNAGQSTNADTSGGMFVGAQDTSTIFSLTANSVYATSTSAGGQSGVIFRVATGSGTGEVKAVFLGGDTGGGTPIASDFSLTANMIFTGATGTASSAITAAIINQVDSASNLSTGTVGVSTASVTGNFMAFVFTTASNKLMAAEFSGTINTGSIANLNTIATLGSDYSFADGDIVLM